MSTKNQIVGLAAVIIIIGGVWYFTHKSAPAPSQTEPIRIGFIAPLTGDAAAFGVPAQNAVKLAVEQINKNGGIAGRQIEVSYEDGKCTGQDAASAAQKLVNATGVKYIIGGFCSSESFAIVPIASPAKVVVISPGSSAPKLSESGPYFLRNNPNDNAPGIALADYAAKKYKAVAIISEQTDYGQGIKSVFSAEAQKQGLAIVSTQDYTSDTTDFRSLLVKVQSAHPDVIFINPQTSANFLRIAKQARQLGISAAFMTTAVADDTKIISPDSGTAINGAVITLPPGLTTDGKGASFTADYTAAYGAAPSFGFYAAAAYDDVYLLGQAISSAGDDSTKVEQYLHAMPSYTGAIGTYSFDQNGDLVGMTPVIQQIANGKLVGM